MMNSKIDRWILLADLLWLNGILTMLHLLRQGSPFAWVGTPAQVASVAGISATWLILSVSFRLDGFRRGWRLASAVSLVIVGGGMFAVVMALAWPLLRPVLPGSGRILAGASLLLLGGFVGIRGGARLVLKWLMSSGRGRRTVVLGTGTVVTDVAARILKHPELLCRIIGYLLPYGTQDQLAGAGAGVQQATNSGLPELLQRERVDSLVAVLPQTLSVDLMSLLDSCRRVGIEMVMVPEAAIVPGASPAIIEVDGLSLFSFRQRHGSPVRQAIKRVMDVLLALVMLVIASPIVFAAAVFLKIHNGNAFQRQTYCGKDGRTFGMFCLAVDRWREDLTGVERLLRLLRLTELPQLINVLRGEMSIVGPRPQTPDTVKHYSEWLKERLRVKPGLTGLAQINTTRLLLRRAEHEPSALDRLSEQYWLEEKARFDLRYITDFDPAYDLSLLLQTPWNLATRLWESRGSQGRVKVP